MCARRGSVQDRTRWSGPGTAEQTGRKGATSRSDILVSLADHPVLFSAPHGRQHVRDGVPKNREDNTSVLATGAARLSGARAIVLAAPSDEDGNWDPESRFRAQVGAIMRAAPGVLIDVHGMRDDHGPDLIVGTAGGLTPGWLVDLITVAAPRFSILAEVRDHGPLSAGPRTLTAHALGELAMPAVQLELAARVRDAYASPVRFGEVVRFLASLADGVSGREPWKPANAAVSDARQAAGRVDAQARA